VRQCKPIARVLLPNAHRSDRSCRKRLAGKLSTDGHGIADDVCVSTQLNVEIAQRVVLKIERLPPFQRLSMIECAVRRNQNIVGSDVRFEIFPVFGFEVVPESALQRFTAGDVSPFLRLTFWPYRSTGQETDCKQQPYHPEADPHGAILQQPLLADVRPTEQAVAVWMPRA
jgi:hypothetical protein